MGSNFKNDATDESDNTDGSDAFDGSDQMSTDLLSLQALGKNVMPDI